MKVEWLKGEKPHFSYAIGRGDDRYPHRLFVSSSWTSERERMYFSSSSRQTFLILSFFLLIFSNKFQNRRKRNLNHHEEYRSKKMFTIFIICETKEQIYKKKEISKLLLAFVRNVDKKTQVQIGLHRFIFG